MNPFLAAGAALAIALGLAHSYLGERYILIRLFRRADLPRLFGSDFFTRRTLRFAWHLTSLAWWSFAALLLVYGARGVREPETAALTVIAVTFLISAIVACVGSRGRHYAWIVFLLIAVAVWLGID